MKPHTSGFKDAIKEMGRELNGIITYGNTTLEDEIMSVSLHYEANLLKSVMKQLDLELSVDIPLGTVINCQIGIKVNDAYEMLNYGDFIVYSSEKQEDTNTYKLVCYDYMILTMKDNVNFTPNYPITLKNYLIALGNHLGINVASTTFYNENLTIPSELYQDQGYTYRDILDELAQATGSMICINANNEIEIKYPEETNDTVDEDFLKDVNVDFKEKYGPINSIVLSRSGESDTVYLKDDESVEENGLCEIKIIDNQIMNFNNRSDFLQGILDALDGTEYYINDFNSTGILYYEVGDYYNINVRNNTYKCLMLNDEINVTTGIEEIIHTEMPEQGETDYDKADKTDRRINQTYIIVDKQNQRIDSVVSNVTEQNNKISQITQTVDEINTKIQDIADITTYGESDRGVVDLEGINQSEPIMIKVHPTATNISYLYPRNNLYPSDTQYLPNRIVRFVRTYDDEGTTRIENIDYEIPDDLLRYDSDTYDEFYLDYDSHTCQVIKRCEYNADGTVSVLANEVTVDYPYPEILLGDGDYQILLYGYDYGYLYVRLMAQNIYTTQFATKAEVTSSINQKAGEIDLSVNQKLMNYSTTTEMNSAISVTANQINSTVSQKVGKNEVISSINQSAEAVTINANKVNLAGKTIDLTSGNITIASTNFNVDKNGNVTANSLSSNNATITGGKIKIKGGISNTDLIRVENSSNSNNFSYIQPVGAGFVGSSGRVDIVAKGSTADHSMVDVMGSTSSTTIYDNRIVTPTVQQTSLESEKKNFEKFEKGLETINNIDIYKYNLKNEDDRSKKHIGFVIGEKYKYSKEITSKENDGVDIYSFIAVCCQAIKEQQEQIKQMKNEIKKLKGGE